ncbi:ABC transporter ATP-binding protein [Vallitalea okinawensis]|uniref:ABC transporter ATP-binding protein n=1 Tax=Vallitalea okinawensis TaxID=2078660 RepID=UPI000CFCDE50|nr:ABC transporter ATP-binding protein [Vallitalea okinawensis]
MIQVKKLTKKIDDHVILKDVNIHVKEGSIYGLVGPNGAGKTTLIKHLVGIYTQNSGDIEILGEKIYENIEIKDRIAYISDDLYYFPQYTVKSMAKFYSNIFSNWCWERYEKLKEIINIDENMKVNKMSKGMKKQVAFWLAISHFPEVIILDEPVDGLDPIARKKIWSLLIQDVAQRKTTILVSSHNLRELEDVCDTVGIMHDGKVLIEKELDNLKSNVVKVQVAFEGDMDASLEYGLTILNKEQTGSVYTLIVKGNREELIKQINSYKPLVLDVLPLTLEEVFIYEVRGAGYEVKDVIL